LSSLSPERTSALLGIAKLSGWPVASCDALRQHLAGVDAEQDSAYGAFFAALHFSWSHKRPLFVYLDWKEAVSELVACLLDAGRLNFQQSLTLELGRYAPADEVAVYEDGVFEWFDAQLRKCGLQMAYLNTNGDDYALVVLRVGELEAMTALVGVLGFGVTEIL